MLITVQFVLVVFHDMVDIPGWAHGSQVRAVVGLRKFWIGTLINAVFPGIAVFFALRFWGGPAPERATNYWALYCGITVLSAITMWWLPYFFGAKEETRHMYAEMYANTKQVLPARGQNPRPNLLHLYFHALFLLNFGLALYLRFAAS